MHRALTLALLIAGVLALSVGAVVWEGRRAPGACDAYLASLHVSPNLGDFRLETEWAWRKLEWECVFTFTRTGLVQRVDIDDAP